MYKVIPGLTKCRVGEEMSVSAADGSICVSLIAFPCSPALLSPHVVGGNRGGVTVAAHGSLSLAQIVLREGERGRRGNADDRPDARARRR
jgi:hypothetical protein